LVLPAELVTGQTAGVTFTLGDMLNSLHVEQTDTLITVLYPPTGSEVRMKTNSS